MTTDIEFRPLSTNEEYAACVALQQATWGPAFTETVPPAMLRVVQKIGGIAAGAFDGDELIGFIFGITGIEHGKPVHWSDMLAVRGDYRNRGIGERLKWYQRAVLLERGITRMYWTFDPLDAKNAYLNFCKLGIIAREYVPEMYGKTDSPLHVLGTDRLIAIWEMASSRVTALSDGATTPQASVDETVEVPGDIHGLVAGNPQLAREWRARTREQFTRLLPQHVVTGFLKGQDGGRYALTSASNFAT